MQVPRTILYTGKGGVGKTSVAAATARRCAQEGLRTIVMSTDPAHSLSDSLGARLGHEPTQIASGLWGQEVRAQDEMEAHWAAARTWLATLLADRGIDRIRAEELTVPPGMDELFSLLQIKRHHASGDYDAVIVDCAPTGETLRLLGFPDIARWWLDRVFPRERWLLNAARPIARTLDIAFPDAEVVSEVQRLVENLIEMDSILRDHRTCSVRLVMNPDRMVIREAQRTFTYLNLYGYLTDAVIVNRVFPPEVGGYFAGWRERQQEHMATIADGFSPVPILEARYFDQEVAGDEMLDRLGAELWAGSEPAALMYDGFAHRLSTDEEGEPLLVIPIPFAEREDIDLKKVGDELIVSVGGERRTIILPAALADQRPSGAAHENGILTVRFEHARPSRPQPQHA